jgi:intraflagellar transport protein 80
VITALKFNMTGEYLAVGLFETLKLCDKTGWTHCVSQVNHGSVLNVEWHRDSNTLYCGFGDGSVDCVAILEKSVDNDTFHIVQMTSNLLQVNDVIHEITEDLEFEQSVTLFEFAYKHFLVATESKMFI